MKFLSLVFIVLISFSCASSKKSSKDMNPNESEEKQIDQNYYNNFDYIDIPMNDL